MSAIIDLVTTTLFIAILFFIPSRMWDEEGILVIRG
jgi:hypothetical protein